MQWEQKMKYLSKFGQFLRHVRCALSHPVAIAITSLGNMLREEMNDAPKVFDEIPVRDFVAWTAFVIGYVQNRESEKGVKCAREMYRVGDDAQRPKSRTLEGGFLACGNLGVVLDGRYLNTLVVKNGIGSAGPLKRLTNLMHQAGNKFCADCGTPEPKWVSSSVRAHDPSVRDHDPCARVLRGMQQNVSVIAPAAGKGTAADCLLLARGQTQQIARVIAIAHAMLQNAHVKYV